MSTLYIIDRKFLRNFFFSWTALKKGMQRGLREDFLGEGVGDVALFYLQGVPRNMTVGE